MNSRLPWFIALCWSATCSGQGLLPDAWYVRNSPTTNSLNAVAYGRPGLVAAGAQGAILTSSNGLTWVTSSAGGSTPPFFCGVDGNYGLVVGGAGGTFLWPWDQSNWTNGLSVSSSVQVFGITFVTTLQDTYPYGYVAVGSDTAIGSSYIFLSYDGRNWTTTRAPITNALFAVASLAPEGNVKLPGTFVAVGDGGTIITSSDGTNWVVRNSGTTAALRALTLHRGILLAGGNDGVILSSSNGVSWSAAAPTSFNIRGLASDGDVVVAVGNYGTEGRLQISANGLSWPGNALEFSNSLNAVAYGQYLYSFVAVGDGGLIVQSSEIPHCPVNSWTNATSGYWEDAFWSCGHLPSAGDSEVAFTNAGWKALAIGPSTTAGFSSSLFVNNLTLGAPDGSSNTFLLNYAGTNVPLFVKWLSLENNASLLSYYSALNASDASLYSPASFLESSVLQAGYIRVWSNLTLSNSVMAVNLDLHVYTNSSVNQSGGSSEVYAVVLDGGSVFNLDGGTLHAHELCLEAYPDFYDGGLASSGLGTFVQTSGSTTADAIKLGTYSYDYQGRFFLQGGSLYCSNYQFLNGTINQSGGTNTLGNVAIPVGPPPLMRSMRGDYELSGGILISGSVTLGTPQSAGEKDFTDDGYGFISQSGGLHLNTGGIVMPGFMLSLFQSPYQLPHGAGSYSLSGGILICSNLDASFGGYSQSGGTNYTTSIIFSDPSLTGGALITSNTTITGFVYDLNHPCAPPPFFATQSNGMHYVQNTFHVGQVAIYDLQGGSLSAGNIEIEQNGILNCGNGVISNWGTFALSGTFRAGTQSHYLGKLQTLLSTNSQWCSSTNNNTLDVSGPTGTFIRFRDSRDTSGAFVQVLNWQPWIGTGSSHHIFFGTNAEALTQSELNLLRFVNPAGWPPGNYSARILSTGEIVPPVPPSLIAGKNGNALVLSWPGDYQLVTATNVLGPYSAVAGATSPFTNLFTGQERYFRLALAGP